MNLTYALFPGWLHWLAAALCLPLLYKAILCGEWRRFQNRELLNVLLGGCVFLLLIASLKAGIKPGLNFHLLGATLFTLLYGWQVAFIAICLEIIGSALYGFIEWRAFAINALLMGALPILFSQALYRVAVWYMPHHFFVYILVNGFLCGGLAMALTVLSSSLLLITMGPYSYDTIKYSYLAYLPFMIFGEGFMTGMLLTVMALLKPNWLLTFDERRYIIGK